MKIFYHILSNTLIATITNTFVWFALTYWIYLETKSVLGTSIMTGIYLVTTTLSGFWFGSIVDHNKKKYAKLISSIATFILFTAGFLLYNSVSKSTFTNLASVELWALVVLILFGVIAGNIRNIALPTLTTILVPEDKRDRANGMSGTVIGLAFSVASVASGFILAFAGMFWVLLIGILLTLFTIIHLFFIKVPEKTVAHSDGKPQKIDLAGTISVIKSIPGLFALLFFNTLNNFLGGVFMPLMDAYGLSLVSLQVWGVLWGFLSLGFIFGGLYIAKKGLGKDPLRKLFITNVITWTAAIFCAIQPSIALLTIGMLIWICFAPFIEASEQTILQKVVPPERQGRVFGFAQSVESAALPLTAFLTGPITQFIFIPFMTTGTGVNLIGNWFGVGPSRGIALVFTLAGIVGLLVTLLAMKTRSYKLLSERYQQ